MSYTQPTIQEIERRRADLAPFDGWNERAFCQLVAWNGIPDGYLDLGSGTGATVHMARKMGVNAYGVDVINGPEGHFFTHDLTKPLYLEQQFKLITCLEVAEHLPLTAHATLVDTIARHAAPGFRLIFSAAPPGQGGEHHVGCRPSAEWKTLFHDRGISYRDDYTRQLAHLIGWVAGPAAVWLAANLQVYDNWDGEPYQEIG